MNKQSRRDQHGMTLIEVVIVLAIVGIITAFAYPSYKNQVYKSRRADGQSMLLETIARQQRHHSENNSYTDQLDALGYSADADTEYNFDDEGNLLSKEKFYLLEIDECKSPNDDLDDCVSLTATPRGDQANDNLCSALTINSLGQKSSDGDSNTADCW